MKQRALDADCLRLPTDASGEWSPPADALNIHSRTQLNIDELCEMKLPINQFPDVYNAVQPLPTSPIDTKTKQQKKKIRKVRVVKPKVIDVDAKPAFTTRPQCNECGKIFTHLGNLSQHKRNVHSNERRFACEFCGKRFHTKHRVAR
jgi:hypothetical protein